ncbi:tetratricopeptide repeat protein [Enterovibrio makurazakiensis]|uniref:RNA polymerase sigma factor n=1 Tax=Enterovibrio makurazakiensis TaxID=2910232 RepID=UPI003D1A927E
MKNAVPKAIAVSHIIDEVLRRDRGRILSGLISRFGDFQMGEDALQEASVAALKHWGRVGIPHDPVAWLMKVGLNKGIDQIRSAQREAIRANDLAISTPNHVYEDIPETIPDERLRLIFTCCHPALEEKSRIALTLRTVCHLTTREIAAAFLDNEQTMGQRLSRAKKKIRSKGISFSVPESEGWTERLGTVLSTIYLIFTTGYVREDTGPRDLCEEGIFLMRLLRKLCPNEPEIEGALALMLLTDARRVARIDGDGAIVPIEEQNEEIWQNDMVAEGRSILEDAIGRMQPGPFQIKAAIADCHMLRPKPDWPQMSLLYRALWVFEPTPVVALNWSVVIAETGHYELALQKLDELQSKLKNYQPWYAARGHILAKLGEFSGARNAYIQAIDTAPSDASRKLLERKLDILNLSNQPKCHSQRSE